MGIRSAVTAGLTAAIVGVGLATGVVAPASASAAAHPTRALRYVHRHGRWVETASVRPSRINIVTYPRIGEYVANIRWSSWSRGSAHGHGTVWIRHSGRWTHHRTPVRLGRAFGQSPHRYFGTFWTNRHRYNWTNVSGWQ